MIIVMKPQAAESSITAIKEYIEGSGLNAHLSQGTEVTIIGVVGDKSRLSTENLISFKDVDRIVPVTETYKLANKKFHPEPSVVQVGPTVIGPDNLTIMAGPCAVETQEQLMSIAHAVKAAGRHHTPRRRLQAQDLPLLLPGPGGRRPALHAGSQKGNRAGNHLRGGEQ